MESERNERKNDYKNHVEVQRVNRNKMRSDLHNERVQQYKQNYTQILNSKNQHLKDKYSRRDNYLANLAQIQ